MSRAQTSGQAARLSAAREADRHSLMNLTTHQARITVPIRYKAVSGRQRHIPVGPCLIERLGDGSIEIIWGPNGQHAAMLPGDEFLAARDAGALVLLD
jgi:hypothetical protein